MPQRCRVLVETDATAAPPKMVGSLELTMVHAVPKEGLDHREAHSPCPDESIDSASLATTASGASLPDGSPDSLREFRGLNWL
jgi:hypothetical protein